MEAVFLEYTGAVPCFREIFPSLDRDEAYRIDQSAARLRAAEVFPGIQA